MKTLITAFVLLLILNDAIAQHVSDTLYRSDIDDDGSVNTIYIERNNTSPYYLEVSDFSFGLFDTDTYKYSLRYLADSNVSLIKRKIDGMPLKWANLEVYKDSFYLYKPCDFLYTNQVSITDTAYIHYTGEGPFANSIINYHKLDCRTFQFQLYGEYQGLYMLTIYIIDIDKGIAVFEERSGCLITRYPMIDVAKMRSRPIIVNDCIGAKASEYTFSDLDYDALISKKYRCP